MLSHIVGGVTNTFDAKHMVKLVVGERFGDVWEGWGSQGDPRLT